MKAEADNRMLHNILTCYANGSSISFEIINDLTMTQISIVKISGWFVNSTHKHLTLAVLIKIKKEFEADSPHRLQQQFLYQVW